MSMIKFTPRPRYKVAPEKMDALYDTWATSQKPADFDVMIVACMDTVYAHNKGFGHDDADIISSNAALRIVRALPGYQGKPLKLFDRSKGKFSSFVARVGKSAMKDWLKQQTPLHAGDHHLAFPADNSEFTAEETTEFMDWCNNDPWHSDGRRWTDVAPDYDEVEDPFGKATFGVSAYSGTPDWEE
jgi:hypothetical protein